MADKLYQRYQHETGEILRIIQFHDNPKNPYRYRVWDTDYVPIEGSDRNLTKDEVLALIPDGFEPIAVKKSALIISEKSNRGGDAA